MATERQEYAAMLPSLQPPQAVSILNDRVLQVGRLNAAIADWLQERRRLEEQYSAGLRRLAQKPLDTADLGIFSAPWSTLMASTDTLADSHSTLASKIEVDVERPLREFANNNREMSAMTTVQGNFQALAREVEKAQQKSDKLIGKGERAESSKVATANLDLDTARAQWDSQAPYVFENLQALDEARLNHLRDALTQFQTHETDQVERNKVSAEQCLNVLLNVETADEIKTFSIKAVQGKPATLRAQRNSVAAPSRAVQPTVPNTISPSVSRSEEDLARERSGSAAEDKQKGRLKGGLKRFGTVMGRKRDSKLPSGPSTSDSPAQRPRPSPLNSFGGRFGRSRENAPTLETMEETSPRVRPGPPPQLGSEIFNLPSEARADPTTLPAARSATDQSSQMNGISSAALLVAGMTNGSSHQSDLRDIEPPAPVVQRERKESLAALEGQTDSEGFSAPPQNLDPITQAQRDAGFAEEGPAPQFSLNIRDAPIQEEGGSAEASLASAANRLQAPPVSAKRTSTVRGRRQDRSSAVNSAFIPPEQAVNESVPETSPSASRDLPETTPIQTNTSAFSPAGVIGAGITQSPSTVFAPGQLGASTFSPFSPQPDAQSPLRPDSRATGSVDQGRTDSQSIRSATTTGSQGGSRHPDLTDSGLNASILETVSARFEDGKLTSSSLIGEIALAYNPADFSSPFGNESIRLENFSNLEKVAPNPAFIKQTPDRDGEYSVSLAGIARTQVAFKYQVRADDSGSQAPLLVTPAFRIEANQSSVIVSYSLNPNFDLHGQESVTLSNVTLALSIEGAKAGGCQSKPVGTFSREKNLIYWPLGDVTLSPGGATQKLLARFATDSEASGGNIEARWEISGDNAQNFGSGLSVSIPDVTGADPFADESAQSSTNWKTVQGMKKLASGGYFAK